MATMNNWERIEATISVAPVDRTPYSFWRHFYDRETSADGWPGPCWSGNIATALIS